MRMGLLALSSSRILSLSHSLADNNKPLKLLLALTRVCVLLPVSIYLSLLSLVCLIIIPSPINMCGQAERPTDHFFHLCSFSTMMIMCRSRIPPTLLSVCFSDYSALVVLPSLLSLFLYKLRHIIVCVCVAGGT